MVGPCFQLFTAPLINFLQAISESQISVGRVKLLRGFGD